MKSLEYIGSQINTLYLLSPDGIGTRWLNWSQIIPRWLRRAVVANADFLLRCSSWLKDRNLIPFFVEWFLRKHLSTEEDRIRLLHTWLSFESFIIQRKRIQELLKLHFIKLVIIIGNRDKLLKIERIEQFVIKLPNAKLYKMEANHLLNINEVAEIILANITTSPEPQ
ncbi:MAG: hypothetical protein IPJ74_03665 [Saprospiraceae bacterium]|nr:hypothetical protein [Saprospiraceae bacterium]